MQGAFAMNTPNISVVAVTYCRPRELERCLEALSQQSVALREVVAVDIGAAMVVTHVRYVKRLPQTVW